MKNKKMTAWFLLLLALSILTACQSTKEIILVNKYSEEEFKRLNAPTGYNAITGSALIRQNNGGIQTCAGYEVALIPATAYSSERINWIYGNTEKGYKPHSPNEVIIFTPEAPGYSNTARRTICNPQGAFTFEKINDGEYFVTTTITWIIMNGIIPSNHVYSGGSLFQRVKLSGKNKVEIVLSP